MTEDQYEIISERRKKDKKRHVTPKMCPLYHKPSGTCLALVDCLCERTGHCTFFKPKGKEDGTDIKIQVLRHDDGTFSLYSGDEEREIYTGVDTDMVVKFFNGLR